MDTAKQMQMAFMMEEGGLTDDGTNMDPVSGNEVPPGSMAEEVRDDIPAQLSEGEYVVPADVVRFYGVKFFEDLRSEAKRGLMDMEENGRIGGEPVAQTIDNQTGGELTPEELAALEQITGMAVGGMVQPTQSTNPYLQQQQMYQNPAPVAMGNTGQYNKGGQVLYASNGPDISAGTAAESQTDPYQAQFGTQQASMFSPGYLIDQTLSTPQNPVRTITMYGPNGEVEILTLPAQQTRYEELLELGYSETQVQTTTETAVGRDEGNDQSSKTKTGPEPIDVSKIKSEDLAKTAKSLGAMTTIATAVASTVGVPITALVNAGMVAQYNDIIDRMKSEGIDTEGMEKKGSIFGGESSLYENLKDTGGNVDKDGNVIGDGKVGFGDTWLGDLLGFDGKAGVQGDNLRDSFGGSRRTGGGSDDDGGTPVVTPSSNGNNNNDEPFSGEPTGPSTAQQAQASVEAEVGLDAFGGSGSVSPTGDDEGYGTPFNQGGMVKRRNNKKKK
jgi:hypothetical protein